MIAITATVAVAIMASAGSATVMTMEETEEVVTEVESAAPTVREEDGSGGCSQ